MPPSPEVQKAVTSQEMTTAELLKLKDAPHKAELIDAAKKLANDKRAELARHIDEEIQEAVFDVADLVDGSPDHLEVQKVVTDINTIPDSEVTDAIDPSVKTAFSMDQVEEKFFKSGIGKTIFGLLYKFQQFFGSAADLKDMDEKNDKYYVIPQQMEKINTYLATKGQMKIQTGLADTNGMNSLRAEHMDEMKAIARADVPAFDTLPPEAQNLALQSVLENKLSFDQFMEKQIDKTLVKYPGDVVNPKAITTLNGIARVEKPKILP